MDNDNGITTICVGDDGDDGNGGDGEGDADGDGDRDGNANDAATIDGEYFDEDDVGNSRMASGC